MKKYGFEFISIFIGVISAFALNSWYANLNDRETEQKILKEIHNGLTQDMKDMELNVRGHEQGLRAISYFLELLNGGQPAQDSLSIHYFNLFRNFVTVQNTSGYESMKSKGLDIVEDDSLRFNIIHLYEFYYPPLEKIEETYAENMFHSMYYEDFNRVMTPLFDVDSTGGIRSVEVPVRISTNDRKLLLISLWKMKIAREFTIGYYMEIKSRIVLLKSEIESKLSD